MKLPLWDTPTMCLKEKGRLFKEDLVEMDGIWEEREKAKILFELQLQYPLMSCTVQSSRSIAKSNIYDLHPPDHWALAQSK